MHLICALGAFMSVRLFICIAVGVFFDKEFLRNLL